jgi:XTP/dITP diphosphohydrolase
MRRLKRGTRLVVASHNPGKLWEINELIRPYGLEAVSAGSLGLPEPEETETTFAGNARLKALAAARGAGLPALADDSGLAVDDLDGAPGVTSARWAGPGRDFGVAMQRLADALSASGPWRPGEPRAHFVSALCLAWPDGDTHVFEGRVDGRLVWPPRGGNGFGYDPMFQPEGHEQTFGEMEPAAKYAMSHRTSAFEAFRAACLEAPVADATDDPERRAREAEALAAAAANLSTRAELATFVARLRWAIEDGRHDAGDDAIAHDLAALEAWLHTAEIAEEPRWRTLAKALLAATARRRAR